jgi:hydrogenase 3 maturation protease
MQGERLLVIDAGPSPESFSGPLRRFSPDLVILVDAAELGMPAGAVRVFHWQDAQGMSASTHGMPPTLLAKYLVSELGCDVALVGIQPRQLDFDTPVTPEVRRAVRSVVRSLQHEIARHL